SEKFKWEPLTKADWDIRRDSAKGYVNAAILFEKIIANDEDLNIEETTMDVYQRIRVFSEAGRGYADLELSYIENLQEFKDLEARCVRPDGTVWTLAKDQIHESDIIATE